jgi:hypothetical protein
MRNLTTWWLLVAAVSLGQAGKLLADDPPSQPAKKAKFTLHVEVDTSDAPDLARWAAKAKTLVEKWHPVITDYLKTKGFTPPSEIKMIFRNQKLVAGTSGDKVKTITFSAEHIRRHPDDFGMAIHELVHCIQCYPQPEGWLVEGIADYIRFNQFEPDARLGRIDPVKASYKDGYKTAATFLFWIERKYRWNVVLDLNRAMRNSDYSEELFEKRTGKKLDDLWREFTGTLPR